MLDIRCPACVELGYTVPRFFFCVDGEMTIPETPVMFAIHCTHCKSDVQWRYGINEFTIVKLGERNHHKQIGAFE